jgi:hypothetical protein
MDDRPVARDTSIDAKHHITRPEDDHRDQLASRGLQLPDELKDYSTDERHELELKLKRKIDLRLLPMVILMYIMNYLDRNNIAAARIAGPNGKGLQDELGLSSTEYQVRPLHFLCFPSMAY